MSSYKYNARLSSSPKVVGSHIHEHSSSSQRNTIKGIKIKQRTPRTNGIRLQPDFDGYSDSSDSTNCSELSNTSNNINSFHQSRKNSFNGRSINNNGAISKRTSISAKRSSLTERPPIPIKNNNIIKKKSIDSTNYELLSTSSVSSTTDKKLLNISINDQANDRALRKIMDLEILNESLRNINESLECTVKEQTLKMEQLQLQIDHLKSASSLNSTANDDFLFDFLLTKDTTSDSEIKIIPRHPQHANKSSISSNQISSPSLKQNVVNESEKSLLSNSELIENSDVQFKRICAKLEILINDASRAVELKPKDVEQELTKEKRLSQDPNDIKIERRHNQNGNNNNSNNELLNDKNSIKASESNITLIEDENSIISNNNNNNDDENNNSDLTKIDEETINEKSELGITSEIISELPKEKKTPNEINIKYVKLFNMIEKLNDISKDVINESTKIELSQNLNNKDQNQNKDDNIKSSSNKGLAMLLNPLLNYQTNEDNINNKSAIPESTNKIKELSLSMNEIIGSLMEALNEEKQKELKQNEKQLQEEKITNNNVRCPIVITSVPPNEKPNKSGFNRRNSSVKSPKFSRSTSVERGVNVGGDSSESMMKINAILNSNGNTVVNGPGYPSILASIPFKKENKLFYRTRTWDPQYLSHYRSLTAQATSSLRNKKSSTLASSSSSNVINTNKNDSNIDNNNDNDNNSSTSSPTSSSNSNHQTKTSINENELKFQNFVQGLERKRTHLPSFYL
jgi:hypothetical protein